MGIKDCAIQGKYLTEERFRSPYISNQEIPWPFPEFGKHINTVLNEKKIQLKEAKFHFHPDFLDSAELNRKYSNKEDKIQIEYSNSIQFKKKYATDYDKPFEVSSDVGWRNAKNLEIKPEKFYDLFTNEKLTMEDIEIKSGNSFLFFSKGKGDLFHITGSVEKKDLESFLLKENTNNTNKEDFSLETYITKENAYILFENVISNLIKG